MVGGLGLGHKSVRMIRFALVEELTQSGIVSMCSYSDIIHSHLLIFSYKYLALSVLVTLITDC